MWVTLSYLCQDWRLLLITVSAAFPLCAQTEIYTPHCSSVLHGLPVLCMQNALLWEFFFFFVEQAFLALLKVSILNLDFGGYFSVLTCLILNKRLNRALNSVSIWIKRAVHLIIPMLYSGGHAEVNSRYFDTTQSCWIKVGLSLFKSR